MIKTLKINFTVPIEIYEKHKELLGKLDIGDLDESTYKADYTLRYTLEDAASVMAATTMLLNESNVTVKNRESVIQTLTEVKNHFADFIVGITNMLNAIKE